MHEFRSGQFSVFWQQNSPGRTFIFLPHDYLFTAWNRYAHLRQWRSTQRSLLRTWSEHTKADHSSEYFAVIFVNAPANSVPALIFLFLQLVCTYTDAAVALQVFCCSCCCFYCCGCCCCCCSNCFIWKLENWLQWLTDFHMHLGSAKEKNWKIIKEIGPPFLIFVEVKIWHWHAMT